MSMTFELVNFPHLWRKENLITSDPKLIERAEFDRFIRCSSCEHQDFAQYMNVAIIGFVLVLSYVLIRSLSRYI